MTSIIRRVLGFTLLAGTLFISGCNTMSGGPGPVMTVDGQRMDFDDPVERGRGLVATGQFGLAIDTLTGVVHNDPQNVRALNLLAVTYAQLKRFDLADRYHQQALQNDPNSVAALNNWGYSHLVRGDRARAIDLLQRAAAIKGDQPVVMANLLLATRDEPAAAEVPEPDATPASVLREVRISDHVVMVKRTGKLVRLSPIEQLLVTSEPVAGEPQPVATGAFPVMAGVRASPVATGALPPLAGARASLPYIVMQDDSAAGDARTRVFAALQRLLDPSPFGFFPEVDDFQQTWPGGSDVPGGQHQSVAWLGS